MTSTLHYPLTFAAAKRAEKGQWAIGDALLEEIGPPRAGARQEAAFKDCAAELADAGMPYAIEYLMKLRSIAHKFDLGARVPGLTARNAIAAGTPAVYEKAVAVAQEEGVPLTQRKINKVRKGSKKQDRKNKGLPEAPERDKSRVTTKPQTALRREIDLSEIELLPTQASKLGRDFAKSIAGFEFSDEEREDVLDSVEKVLSTWTAVRDAVANPVAAEAERYLRAVN